MEKELFIHVMIGIVSWLIGSRHLKHKALSVLLAVIVGQVVYAIIHYPIALSSAQVLQLELTPLRYLYLLPFRIPISFLAAFILYKSRIVEGKSSEDRLDPSGDADKSNKRFLINMATIFCFLILFIIIIPAKHQPNSRQNSSSSEKAVTQPILSEWEQKAAAQKSKNRKVANLVGFQIIREDKEGNQIPLDGDCESDFEFKVKYKGRLVLSSEYACHMDVIFHETLGDEHLVLFEHNGQGVGGEKQTLMTFSTDTATLVENDYWILGESGRVEKGQDEIKLIDFAGCGKRSIGIYRDHKITRHKENIVIPSGLSGAKKYAAKDDAESILLIPELNSTLRKLMNNKYNDLESLLCSDWSYRRTIAINNELVTITGVPQRFGRYPIWDDAFLSINTATGDIYSAYLEHGYGKSPNIIYGFSTKPALFAEPPKEMKDWLKEYPDAKEKWRYGE